MVCNVAKGVPHKTAPMEGQTLPKSSPGCTSLNKQTVSKNGGEGV